MGGYAPLYLPLAVPDKDLSSLHLRFGTYHLDFGPKTCPEGRPMCPTNPGGGKNFLKFPPQKNDLKGIAHSYRKWYSTEEDIRLKTNKNTPFAEDVYIGNWNLTNIKIPRYLICVKKGFKAKLELLI